MAFAIIWVICFHLKFPLPGILNSFEASGFNGVEIFLLASGIGCGYSLRSSDDTLYFLKKRFVKIFPTYWFLITLWIIFRYYVGMMTFPSALGNFFAVQAFSDTETMFNWYMTLLVTTYLLAPVLFCISRRVKSIFQMLMIVAVMEVISVCFWDANPYVCIMMIRFPVFFIGMCISNISPDYRPTKKDLVLVFVLLVIGMAMEYADNYMRYYSPEHPNGMRFYQGTLMAPGLCLSISYLCSLVEKCKIGRKLVSAFSFVGKYTFTLYLSHLFLFGHPISWGMRILLLVPFSVLVEFAGNQIRKLPLFRIQ